MNKEYVLTQLCAQILASKSFGSQEITTKTLGLWLCGHANYKLAEDPFSQDFLMNVSFNGPESLYGILWLQLNKH